MNRYKITYKNKTHISRADSARKAFEKFASRPVFGGATRISNYQLKNCDADTYGKKWAQYKCGWESTGYTLAMSEIA